MSWWRDEYAVQFNPSDDPEQQFTVNVTRPKLLARIFGSRPLARSLDGLSPEEAAAVAALAHLPAGDTPVRTPTGYESLYGYMPLNLSVSKTSAARTWQALRRAAGEQRPR